MDITQTAVLITMSCDQDTFQDPFLFVTILRPDAAASNFDFSFAIKKTMIGPDGGGVHVIPAQAMAVLAAPVLGSMSGDQMSTYEVGATHGPRHALLDPPHSTFLNLARFIFP